MKTLFLLRHAKSSWSDPGLSDFERPLNDRGTLAAPFMGKLMAERSLRPATIVSSPAARAAATARLASDAAGFDTAIVYDHRVYEASPQALRQVASEINDEFSSALIVGHNPGTEGFMGYLTGLMEPMSTASLAVMELAIESWGQIDANCGKLIAIYRPRDEMGSS